jgi:F-box/leucine-rich repeat protein 10/11
MTQPQDDNTIKRLSDAQLLMDFAVSASTPRRVQTPKRWSISQAEASSPYSHRHVDSNHIDSVPSDLQYAHPHQMPPPPEHMYPPELPPSTAAAAADNTMYTMAAQTQTPPEDIFNPAELSNYNGVGDLEETKLKKGQGWPKGKPRGPRNSATSSKKKKNTPKPKSAPPTVVLDAPAQLHSPQSLQAEQPVNRTEEAATLPTQPSPSFQNIAIFRRHSFSDPPLAAPDLQPNHTHATFPRAHSVPLQPAIATTPFTDDNGTHLPKAVPLAEAITICAGCNSSDSETMIGDGEQWIRCDGCKEWHHYVCAGFKSEREVRDVDKFYCAPCQPKFGETTKVRKSTRAHTAVDYAGLNEGILKTSDDNPEHHYIAAFKNGDIEFTPETFARLPPELVSADFLEKSNGFKEPILIPASLNPRPKSPVRESHATEDMAKETNETSEERFAYEMMPDDGQDMLDMVIPEDLTVRRVCELYGPQEKVPVIDVKAQEGEDRKWTMAKWADYYEQQGEKPVRNVISLEVSKSRLGRLIRRPRVVRDLDLQDSVWRDDDKKAPPAVQFYCLMSVADCYTDFHIDFGGSSVYYHIVKGKKVFFFIPPTKQNLKKYEDWCLSPKQGHEFLGHQVKECYRVDLFPGDTMLIPSGWIHAVWTPDDSLVIGGNFLTRIHYSMQIKVLEIEKNTKVAAMFRYPFFQKIMWLALVRYLEEDPLPESVEQHLLDGEQFPRSVPIYCEPQRFGHNSHLGPQNYNRRYYPKAELDGLPDLANYVWRTVLISQGRIEGMTETVRKSVTVSIPKGFGEPSVLARRFAMWIAWKRGNEHIPQWAQTDATLPDTSDMKSEKKMSAAQVKRMEKEAWSDALRATAERHSSRIKSTVTPTPRPNSLEGGHSSGDTCSPKTVESATKPMTHDCTTPTTQQPLTGFLQQTDPSRPLTTPKTSQLGPKRIACDACRKRRIKCKHKEM